MSGTRLTRAAADTATRVWNQVCLHCDGISIGSTMAALGARGGLAAIAARECQGIDELRRTLGARPGYLRVALRLLADQGWVELTGNPATDDLAITPTASGMIVLTRIGDAYGRATELLAMAEEIDGILSGAVPDDARTAGASVLGQAVELMKSRWGLPSAELESGPAAQVAAHLDGHVIAPVMTALSRRGVLRPGTAVYQMNDILAGDGRPGLTLAVEMLQHQGWALCDESAVRLTPAGLVAVACAPQYWHPVCYVPLFRRVPDLLFGDQPVRPAVPPPLDGDAEPLDGDAEPLDGDAEPLDGDAEEHPDRELDIRFSGQVFARTCRVPFLDVVLPIFDQPVEQQPSAVVDIGCGDGTLLATLYEAVRERTRRGRLLGSYPLRLVGAEPSAVARTVAARRLGEDGLPGIVIGGDITDPDGLAATLATAGLDARDVLYVCKSVIHDRPYTDPGDLALPGAAPPDLLSTFADPSGASIPAGKVISSLAALFLAWRGLADKHGFVVIEAHSVDPAVSASLAGRTMATSLDATHGYSNQYPVTPDVFSWAARAGGFISRAHREPGASQAGYTPLTIDHFVVAKG
jgi:hypothetical protein